MDKPFDSYFGGKGSDGTYQTIINHIRPHLRFIEVCAGNATITRKKKPAVEKNILVDINQSVVDSLQNVVPTYPLYEVLCQDAMQFLAFELNYQRICSYKTAIYIDPPYPPSTRKSRKRYKDEMTEEQHKALLQLLLLFDSQIDIMISTRPNDLYAEMLKDWKLVEFQSRQRVGSATEWLFMNYHTLYELHEYTYLGDNHRERQLIKKKVNRWTDNFAELPILQKRMMLEKLNQELLK